MPSPLVLPKPHLSESLDPKDFEIAIRDFFSASIVALVSRHPALAYRVPRRDLSSKSPVAPSRRTLDSTPER
jgi:hypothetical protein